MRGGKPLGYTIVEVLIVLAVSGLMFVIAANFISGKQGKTSFQQGSNELVSRLQTVITDVNDGRYTDIPFTCTKAGASISITGAASATNPDCVLLGKLAHFFVHPSRSQYEVFSLVGAREKAPGVPAVTLADTLLRPLEDVAINFTKTSAVPQNLEVTDMKVTDTAGTVHNDAYSLGFMQGLGSQNTSGNYNNGANNVTMIFDTLIGPNEANNAALRAKITPANILEAQSACILISDGTRSARVNIGTNDAINTNKLSVTVKQLGESVATC